MIRNTLILLGLILTLESFSQAKLLRIEKNVNEFYSDTLYCQIDFHYSNDSDSTLILWIEKDTVASLSNSNRIRNHFFTRKGDWSLMGLIWDGNVESFTPGLFDSFMKIIKEKEQFTVSFLSKGKINPDSVNSLEKHIMIVHANEIRGLSINKSTEMFNYRANSVIVFTDWLNKNN